MTFEYRNGITSRVSTSDIVVFTDGEPSEGLEQAIVEAANGGASGFVLRTTPYEAAYLCDPITAAADCAYCNAFAATTQALTAIGGVDKDLGAAAATDICKRLAMAGFMVKYVPNAVIKLKESPKPSFARLVLGSILMRVKYGRIKDVWQGVIFALKALLHPSAYDVSRGEFLISCFKVLGKGLGLLFARAGKNKKFKNSIIEWYGVELGFARGEYVRASAKGSCDNTSAKPQEQKAQLNSLKKSIENRKAEHPLVSVIIRTRNRPETLRKTLESLRIQTYDNFEIVLIEDGEPLSEQMIKKDFVDFKMTYKATIENVGRASAFNLGVSLADGEMINILDDDDFLAPEHIELGVEKILSSNLDLIFCVGIALGSEKLRDEPYEFKIMAKNLLDFPRLEPFTMVRRCLATAHGVMLKKELCTLAGGMRAELGAHEDWNLWLRIMSRAKYEYLHYATNYYIVPHDKQLEKERIEKYSKFDDAMLNDDSISFETTQQQLRGYYKSVIDDYLYLSSIGRLGESLASEAVIAHEFIERCKIRPASFELFKDEKNVELSGVELKQLYYTLILQFEQKHKNNELVSFLKTEINALNTK